MTNYSAFYTNKDRKYRGGLCRIFTDVDCYIMCGEVEKKREPTLP